MQAGSSAAQYI